MEISGRFIYRSFLAVQWIFLLVQEAECCGYYQEMVFGKYYYINSLNYPGYTKQSNCNWNLKTVAGTKIYLSCPNIEIPSSAGCRDGVLSVSLTGGKGDADTREYCGNGEISLVSQGDTMTVGFRNNIHSPGGRFLCTATAIKSETGLERSGSTDIFQCECGWKQMMRIVGGSESGVNEFTFMAALIYQGQMWCGASIISDRFLLTAGHCVEKRAPSDFLILVGDHDISTGTDTDYSAIYKVDAYEIHPGYDLQREINDIALLRTSTVIWFGIGVGPVCLPFRYSNRTFARQDVVLLGWGLLEFTGERSNTLQKVVIPVLTNQECAGRLGSSISHGEICTYSKEGKDTCQMDSGGPLIWIDQDTSRYQLIGIISHGIGCGSDSPSINTRVTEYLQWVIERTRTNFCVK